MPIDRRVLQPRRCFAKQGVLPLEWAVVGNQFQIAIQPIWLLATAVCSMQSTLLIFGCADPPSCGHLPVTFGFGILNSRGN